MGRALAGGGFDPDRDITGITVNRWPHGYAYQYNSLEDEFWVNGGEQPCATARRRIGRITIANSDAAAYGGSGMGNGGAVEARNGSAVLTLPPLATIMLEAC